MQGVENVADFVDPALLPKGKVRVAALDGENSDPANGLTLEAGLRCYSLWGELAYRLAGADGYKRVEESDRRHVAPGAPTIVELFGGEPTLIMLDEVALYLRKVERVHPGASDQFAAFVHALFKAVLSSPNVALVYTLAVGKDDRASDAYKEETERALSAMAEAEKVAARETAQLNPTEEDETADVLRRRLFDRVDLTAAEQSIAAYIELWNNNRDTLPPDASLPETRDYFRRTYPLHPQTLEMLTEKTSSLSTFQRTRGMLRLLARTVHLLWKSRPADAFAIHPHHIDPGFGPIRDEITVKLQQGDYTPALKADVAAVPGEPPALAQQLDERYYHGGTPVTSHVARTIFWHTLAYGDAARGVSPDLLRLSVCSPAVEPSFVEQARVRFVTDSLYLDDHPGVPLRFMVEPNLNQIIRRHINEIDTSEVRAELKARIGELFGSSKGEFEMSPFPAGPYEVSDEIRDGRPLLVVMNYEAVAVPVEPQGVPAEAEDVFEHKGVEQKLRELRNNLVFVVADEKLRENMQSNARRRLALAELKKPEHMRVLADYQQRKVNEEYDQSRFKVAEAILQCYRHLFYPSHVRMAGTNLDINHTVIELANASDNPGNGQIQVIRILHEQKKLLSSGDAPDAATYVRDQTPLKTKGEITTLALRNEFRRAAKLSILVSDTPLYRCVREGIQANVFIYREGNQVWGPGDPEPSIQISDNAFIHTAADAREKKLWPRAQPLVVRLSPEPETIQPGAFATLRVTVTGGVEPYTYASSVGGLSSPPTAQAELEAKVSPGNSTTYAVEVIDSRGQRQSASATVLVSIDGRIAPVPPPPVPPPTPPELAAKGPLLQALNELWEKARKAKHKRVQKLIVRLYDASATWKVHQSMATEKSAQVSCRFEVSIAADGIETFSVEFEGQVEKANAVKDFLDPQIRAARESDFQADYTLSFPAGLSLLGDAPETLAKNLTRFGGGEAYVEAHIAPPED
jgi:hypothetical protein